jgi:integrase
VFVSERGAPFTTAGFARMLQRAAMATSLTLKVHPHMLRHACGRVTIPAPYKPISGTGTFSIRCATLSWRQTGSSISGRTKAPIEFGSFG